MRRALDCTLIDKAEKSSKHCAVKGGRHHSRGFKGAIHFRHQRRSS
jgi:hypothetical protein